MTLPIAPTTTLTTPSPFLSEPSITSVTTPVIIPSQPTVSTADGSLDPKAFFSSTLIPASSSFMMPSSSPSFLSNLASPTDTSSLTLPPVPSNTLSNATSPIPGSTNSVADPANSSPTASTASTTYTHISDMTILVIVLTLFGCIALLAIIVLISSKKCSGRRGRRVCGFGGWRWWPSTNGRSTDNTIFQFEAMHPHVVVVNLEDQKGLERRDSILIAGNDGRKAGSRMIKVLQFDAKIGEDSVGRPPRADSRSNSMAEDK